MAINDTVYYNSGFLPYRHFTVYPSPYSCMVRWYTIIDISTIIIFETMHYYNRQWLCRVIIGGCAW